MSVSLQDLLNKEYSILKSRQGATAYPVDNLTQFTDSAQKTICSGTVVELDPSHDNVVVQKQALQFLDKTVFYNSIAYLHLSLDAVVWSTTLDLDDTSLLVTPGALLVQGNVITYTGKTATQITGIPISWDWSIMYAFTGWQIAHNLHILPDDFEQAVRAIYSENFRLEPVDYRDINNATLLDPFVYRFFQSDFYSDRLTGQYYYTLISSKYLLPIIPSTSNKPIRLNYQKAPTTLALPADICTIPDTYALNTIPYIATAEMMYNRGEMDEAYRLNAIGVKNVKAMYKKYQQGKNELKYGTRVWTSQDKRYPNI